MTPGTIAWIRLAGGFNLAFAIFHVFFWSLFRWRAQLATLSVANRGIMQVLNLCLIFLFSMMGGLFLLLPDELARTDIGRWLLTGMAGFWLLRLAYQPAFFRLRHPLSVGLFVIFAAGVLLHGYASWIAWS